MAVHERIEHGIATTYNDNGSVKEVVDLNTKEDRTTYSEEAKLKAGYEGNDNETPHVEGSVTQVNVVQHDANGNVVDGTEVDPSGDRPKTDPATGEPMAPTLEKRPLSPGEAPSDLLHAEGTNAEKGILENPSDNQLDSSIDRDRNQTENSIDGVKPTMENDSTTPLEENMPSTKDKEMKKFDTNEITEIPS